MRTIPPRPTYSISLYIAQMGPIGAMKAPGTMATLCTIPLVVLLSMLFSNIYAHALFLLIAIVLSRVIIKNACTYLNNHNDPQTIVLDELIGCLITFWAIPLTATTIVSGFLLFRFFDISKPGGIKYLEKIPYGWGVLLDDVAAAFISNFVLHLFI